MPYTQYYKSDFTNELNQLCNLKIYKNTSTPPAAITDLLITKCVLTDTTKDGEQSSIFNTVISRELTFSIYLQAASVITWETFLSANYDEYKVTLETPEGFLFHGFLVPEQGAAPFRDLPYEIELKATDGLKLLEGINLTKANGDQFRQINSLITYVAGILKKTLLDLPIVVYSNIYHNSMFDRSVATTNDMFNQAQIDYRTFQESPTDLNNSFEALKRLFKDHFKVFYYNGQWVVYRIPEYQYLANLQRWYTVYDSNGIAQYGQQDTDDYFTVGKNELIYPVSQTQFISVDFANKSAKTLFNYTVWPEIPKNNKFERGTYQAGLSTPTKKYYSIEDWDYKQETAALPQNTGPTTGNAYRVSTYDAFGVEQERYLECSIGLNPEVLLAESFILNKGDIISFSITARTDNNLAGPITIPFATIHLIPLDGTPTRYNLDNNGDWGANNTTNLNVTYDATQDTRDWHTISVESKPLPEDGVLQIMFRRLNTYGTNTYYKDFQFTYTPYFINGYLPIKADYWRKEQTANLPDVRSEEVYLSDTVRYVIKGALLQVNGSPVLTTPQWFRYGAAGEDKHYKELVNRGIYNLTYRRFYTIEGDFSGFIDAPANDVFKFRPIGYHKKYRFVDAFGNKEFALVDPLKIDVLKGFINARFREVKDISLSDGIQEGDVNEFKYLFNS